MQQRSDLQKLDEVLASEVILPEGQLADRLSSILSGIDCARAGTYQSDSSRGIFWALTRVFGCYDRLVEACEDYTINRTDRLAFAAELDVEHFLMRLRVLLDEVAYAIRTRLPDNVRSLGRLKGPGKSKYLSITDLLKFTQKNPTYCQPLTHLLDTNRQDIHRFIELRDDIAHFRAKAIVFRSDTMSVGFIGSRDSDVGQKKLQHTELLEYVNKATDWMWHLLQTDLVQYFRRRVENGELGFSPVGIGLALISMPGLVRFRKFLDVKEQR